MFNDSIKKKNDPTRNQRRKTFLVDVFHASSRIKKGPNEDWTEFSA